MEEKVPVMVWLVWEYEPVICVWGHDFSGVQHLARVSGVKPNEAGIYLINKYDFLHEN